MKLTEKEFNAINSLIDLAAQTVSDAEFDHCESRKTTRRNGGYSQDLRIAEKALIRIRKQLQKEKANE